MKYVKLIVAAVGGVLILIAGVWTDGTITTGEWINVGIGASNIVLVGVVPNLNGGVGKYTKAVTAVVLAILMLLVDLISNGLTGPEIIQLILAALTALGVGVIKNPGYNFHTLQPSSRIPANT